jgi:hypothetical protein
MALIEQDLSVITRVAKTHVFMLLKQGSWVFCEGSNRREFCDNNCINCDFFPYVENAAKGYSVDDSVPKDIIIEDKLRQTFNLIV